MTPRDHARENIDNIKAVQKFVAAQKAAAIAAEVAHIHKTFKPNKPPAPPPPPTPPATPEPPWIRKSATNPGQPCALPDSRPTFESLVR